MCHSRALLAGVNVLFIINKSVAQYLSIIKFCSLMISNWVENTNPCLLVLPALFSPCHFDARIGILLSHLEPNRITAEKSLPKKKAWKIKDLKRVALFISS